jgi:hypothetical protein
MGRRDYASVNFNRLLTHTNPAGPTDPSRARPFAYRINEKFGASDTIRTCDLCLRRVTLYPAELRAQCLAVQRPNETNPLGFCCDIVKSAFPALSYDDTAPGDTITYARRPV